MVDIQCVNLLVKRDNKFTVLQEKEVIQEIKVTVGRLQWSLQPYASRCGAQTSSNQHLWVHESTLRVHPKPADPELLQSGP